MLCSSKRPCDEAAAGGAGVCRRRQPGTPPAFKPAMAHTAASSSQAPAVPAAAGEARRVCQARKKLNSPSLHKTEGWSYRGLPACTMASARPPDFTQTQLGAPLLPLPPPPSQHQPRAPCASTPTKAGLRKAAPRLPLPHGRRRLARYPSNPTPLPAGSRRQPLGGERRASPWPAMSIWQQRGGSLPPPLVSQWNQP